MAAPQAHEHWSSRFAFLMAAIGSSVGLGNFWRFPYTAGEGGGAAFVLFYLACVALVAFPILMAEYAIGRKTGLSAVESTEALALEENRSRGWGVIGWVGMLASFLILTFYSVIAGWILIYIPVTVSGTLSGATADEVQTTFGSVTSDVPLVMAAHGAFIALTAFIVARGIKGGIEVAVKYLMPAFFVMLLGIVVFSAISGDFVAAARFLFEPDFSKLGFDDMLSALGQAFFSIGVGVGLMITYGAYLDRNQDIPSSAGIVATSDTLVAIIAGLAIFPIVFAFDVEPNAGPGLFFVTLPTAFAQMPGGAVFGAVFFTLAFFAAITSSISLLEVSVSWFEEQKSINRWGAAFGLGFLIWVIGVGSILSLGFLDFVGYITGSLLLPLGGLLVAVFAGWFVSKKVFVEEFGDSWVVPIWRFLIRYVAPIGVAVILVGGIATKVIEIVAPAEDEAAAEVAPEPGDEETAGADGEEAEG